MFSSLKGQARNDPELLEAQIDFLGVTTPYLG